MSSRLHTIVLSAVIALAMAFGWLLPHQNGRDFSPAVSPAELSLNDKRPSDMAGAFLRHSHETDGEEKRASGALHAHNSAEHLHETPNLAAGIALKTRPFGKAWYGVLAAADRRNAPYELLRPPRTLRPSREA